MALPDIMDVLDNLPTEDGEGVEVAPNIFIPRARYAEFMAFTTCNSDIAQAILDMHEVLTEVAPGIQVMRCDIADWQTRMESDMVFRAAMDGIMDWLNTDGLADTQITLIFTHAGKVEMQRQAEIEHQCLISSVLSEAIIH